MMKKNSYCLMRLFLLFALLVIVPINSYESQDTLEKLLDMIDNGNINEAENQIYDMTSDNNMTNLEVALIFYSYLNDKDDEFLQRNDFCRDEIKSGIKELLTRYELTGMAEIFLLEL